MNRIAHHLLRAATLGLALAAGSGAALAQDRWDWRYDHDYRLRGPGAAILFPELTGTERGRAFVMRNFDRNRDGLVNRAEAAAANRAFAEVAGPNRRNFDWVARETPDDVPVGVPVTVTGGWDRPALRGYGFRDTTEGARMALQEDVLFRTDSADLRPGAIARLKPLADYLRANPGVRVRIVGHTDSRGSDAHNQQLSERRAESVRIAFDGLGVTRARFRVEGRGESQPVASNATAAGMRQNRRVEVTLLGVRADRL